MLEFPLHDSCSYQIQNFNLLIIEAVLNFNCLYCFLASLAHSFLKVCDLIYLLLQKFHFDIRFLIRFGVNQLFMQVTSCFFYNIFQASPLYSLLFQN